MSEKEPINPNESPLSTPVPTRFSQIRNLFIELGIEGVYPRMPIKDFADLELWKIPAFKGEDNNLFNARQILLDATGIPAEQIHVVVKHLNEIGYWDKNFRHPGKTISDLRKLLVDPEDRQVVLLKYKQSTVNRFHTPKSSYALLNESLINIYPHIHNLVLQTLLNSGSEKTTNEELFDEIINAIEINLDEEDIYTSEVLSVVRDLTSKKRDKFRFLINEFLDEVNSAEIAKNRSSISHEIWGENYNSEIEKLKNKYRTESTGELYTTSEFANLASGEKLKKLHFKNIEAQIERRAKEFNTNPEGIIVNKELIRLYYNEDGTPRNKPLIIELEQADIAKNTKFFLTENLFYLYKAIEEETEESRLDESSITFHTALKELLNSLDESIQSLFTKQDLEKIRELATQAYKSNSGLRYGDVQIASNQLMAFGEKKEVLNYLESFINGKLDSIELEASSDYFKMRDIGYVGKKFVAQFQSWLNYNEKRGIKPQGSAVAYYQVMELREFLINSLKLSQDNADTIIVNVKRRES
jgi:hypothetical protein